MFNMVKSNNEFISVMKGEVEGSKWLALSCKVTDEIIPHVPGGKNDERTKHKLCMEEGGFNWFQHLSSLCKVVSFF